MTKPTKWVCAQRRLPPSLIRVSDVRMKKGRVLSYPLSALRRLWSDWADAQADLSLRWAHRSCCWFCHEAAQFSLVLHKNIWLWVLIRFASSVHIRMSTHNICFMEKCGKLSLNYHQIPSLSVILNRPMGSLLHKVMCLVKLFYKHQVYLLNLYRQFQQGNQSKHKRSCIERIRYHISKNVPGW